MSNGRKDIPYRQDSSAKGNAAEDTEKYGDIPCPVARLTGLRLSSFYDGALSGVKYLRRNILL